MVVGTGCCATLSVIGFQLRGYGMVRKRFSTAMYLN